MKLRNWIFKSRHHSLGTWNVFGAAFVGIIILAIAILPGLSEKQPWYLGLIILSLPAGLLLGIVLLVEFCVWFESMQRKADMSERRLERERWDPRTYDAEHEWLERNRLNRHHK